MSQAVHAARSGDLSVRAAARRALALHESRILRGEDPHEGPLARAGAILEAEQAHDLHVLTEAFIKVNSEKG